MSEAHGRVSRGARNRSWQAWTKSVPTWAVVAAWVGLIGCARLPYTTQVVHEDPRVKVFIQQEVEPAMYTHPVRLSPQALKTILAGFSVREKTSLPLRWFAEEKPPQPLFHEDEVRVLAPHLAAALEQAGPTQRVAFQVFMPGFNPAVARATTAGWIAVRDPYWHLTIDHFHVQVPVRQADQYDPNYPLVPEPPKPYLLNFAPGRFWTTDPASGDRVLEYKQFLESPEASPSR